MLINLLSSIQTIKLWQQISNMNTFLWWSSFAEKLSLILIFEKISWFKVFKVKILVFTFKILHFILLGISKRRMFDIEMFLVDQSVVKWFDRFKVFEMLRFGQNNMFCLTKWFKQLLKLIFILNRWWNFVQKDICERIFLNFMRFKFLYLIHCSVELCIWK
jgi:hypothetical protein